MKLRKRKDKKLTQNNIIRILEVHKKEIHNYGVSKIGLFGSFLRGAQDKKSDIDILIEFENPKFDEYMELKFMLEKLFGRKVDLVMINALKPALNYIKKEAVYAKV